MKTEYHLYSFFNNKKDKLIGVFKDEKEAEKEKEKLSKKLISPLVEYHIITMIYTK